MPSLSLKPLLKQLTIKTTALDYRNLDLDFVDPDPTIGDWGWAQRPYIAEVERQYNLGLPVRVICLKARQLGISTATEGIGFWWGFLHRGTNGLILSHEDKSSQRLYNMTRLFWDRWAMRELFSEGRRTIRQISWLETGSTLEVATARNPESARSGTFHFVHASEVGFWADPHTLWAATARTIPQRHKTFVCLESTANGVGNWFHDLWLDAEAGNSEFVPLFFPWYFHAAYRMEVPLKLSELDEEEKGLYKLMHQPISFTRGVVEGDDHPGLTDEEALRALAWRRVEIRKPEMGELKFHQELPATPEEAFVSTGNPIFPHDSLRDVYIPEKGLRGRLYKDAYSRVRFDRDAEGDLIVFRDRCVDPDPTRYFVSSDPSENRHAGDPACIQVIDRRSNHQVAVWHSHASPVVVARQMMLLGDFYHHAMLCPEAEGGGQACIGAIMQAGYGNVWSWKKPDRTTHSFNVWGWATNYNTKLWAITTLRHLIETRAVTIHDRLTFNELANFVEHANGQMGNSSNSPHDDTVMALAIAVTASGREGHFTPHRVPAPYMDLYSTEFDGHTGGDIGDIIPIRHIREA